MFFQPIIQYFIGDLYQMFNGTQYSMEKSFFPKMSLFLHRLLEHLEGLYQGRKISVSMLKSICFDMLNCKLSQSFKGYFAQLESVLFNNFCSCFYQVFPIMLIKKTVLIQLTQLFIHWLIYSKGKNKRGKINQNSNNISAN